MLTEARQITRCRTDTETDPDQHVMILVETEIVKIVRLSCVRGDASSVVRQATGSETAQRMTAMDGAVGKKINQQREMMEIEMPSIL